jgi:hypothetical protein
LQIHRPVHLGRSSPFSFGHFFAQGLEVYHLPFEKIDKDDSYV